jgi:hypothetical protein
MPTESLFGVVSRDVSSVSLRDHLAIAIRIGLKNAGNHSSVVDGGERLDLLDPLDPVVAEFGLLPANVLPDVFKLVMRATKRVYPGEALLDFAMQHRHPLLSLIASHFPDASLCSCLLVWLHASVPDADTVLAPLPPVSSLTPPSMHHQRLELVSQFVVAIMQHESLMCFLQRALQLMDPQSPLLPFTEFQICFSQYRYADATRYLDMCLQRLDDPATEYRIGDRAFTEELVLLVCDNAIRHRMATAFERREYLRILAESGLDTRFLRLFQHLVLMEYIGLMDPHQTFTDADTTEFVPPSPASLLNELLNRKMFELARGFARSNDLQEDLVTEREAAELIVENFKRQTFETHTDRCSVLSQVDELFLERGTGSEVAGHFFLSRAERLSRLLDSGHANRSLVPIRDVMLMEPLPESTLCLRSIRFRILIRSRFSFFSHDSA